jgi:uncharacterized protein (TIGR02099 family)
MSTDPDQSRTNASRIATSWRIAVAAVSHANRVSHHALSWLFVFAVTGYFIFCAIFLSLRYLVLPNIHHYQPEVVRATTQMLNRPVTIAGIQASWHGLNPRLQLEGVVIHDEHGDSALHLPQVNATISWASVLGRLQLDSLEVLSPDLEIERDAQGRWFVAGMEIDPTRPDDGSTLDWLLAQREIVIRGGSVRWNDQLRQVPELKLADVSFVLHNRWRSHQAALQATPPTSLSGPIDLRANFTHPPFVANRADYGQWSGEIYVDWRNTHLDGWSRYADLPWELASGDGALRAWLSFRRGVIADITADLAMRNVTATLGAGLQPLKLVEVSGRIAAGESGSGLKEKLFSFGAQGHLLTLTDFSLRTEQGSVLPRTTASHRFIAAGDRQPERHELRVTELDLDALARLAAQLPLSAAERKLLEELQPRGQLKDFSASWEGVVPGAGDYKLSGSFERLAIREQLPADHGETMAVPGFEGLSGEINANQDGGRLKLTGERSVLHLVDYLNVPTLAFEHLAVDGSWSFRNQRRQLQVKLAALDFRQSGLNGHIDGTHVLPWPLAAGKLGEIDLRAHFPTLELSRLSAYLPSAAGASTRDWMSGGLLDGRADEVNMTLKGNLDKFPFLPTPGAKNAEGVFKLSARIRQGKLSPAPQMLASDRRTPLWATIDDIEGRLSIDRSRLHIHAENAKTAGVALSNVEVVIPDLFAGAPWLEVSGSANGSLPSMLAYVNASPVAGWIDDLTTEARATGSARLNLKMQIPLTDAGQPTVAGSLKFAGNELQLWPALPPVAALRGELGFSERGFQLGTMQGNLLGGPVAISGGTQRDGSMAVKLDGSVTADGIVRFGANPAMKRVARKLSGVTRYVATARTRNQRLDFSLDSSLSGMGIDLPAPLHKTASETLPLRVTVSPVGQFDAATQSEEIRVSFGRAVSARYLRQRPVSKNTGWKLVRGGIGVNAPPPSLDSGIALSVNLPSLNADAWRSQVATTGSDNTSVGDGSSAAQFLSFDVVNVRAGELIFADRSFDNVGVSATRTRGGWQLNIQSDSVAGRASWEDPWSERGAGKISARLNLLKIEEKEASEVADLLSGKKSFTELPGLDVVADNFELRGMRLGRLELAATNAGLPTGAGREWRISKLAIANPGADMRATGRWVVGKSDSQSSLSYEMDITDAGQLLDRLGFEKMLRGGKGKMSGDISWRGDPSEFDLPSMSGSLRVKLGSGQFLKADPGMAKLLGVMSLQSLPRRLTLDFRDVFSEGFSFDSIASTATITRGTLKTDSFKMRGPNAVVLMDGSVDLANETQNLNVVVIPELNTGGASVVYGLAVNPVVGLGAFLAQYFLKNPVSAALTQDYQVTGPWKDPVIKKLPARRKPPESSGGQNGSTND